MNFVKEASKEVAAAAFVKEAVTCNAVWMGLPFFFMWALILLKDTSL